MCHFKAELGGKTLYMADGVKWIKFIIGCTDGTSFKRMRNAKIGGVDYRDKLEAVWFELLDFAGMCNHDGAFIDDREMPYSSIADIATQISRTEEELELCMQFYINAGMVEIIDDIYMLSNWSKYQDIAYLTDKREHDRIKQQECRARRKALIEQQKQMQETNTFIAKKENVNDKSMTNVKNSFISISNSISNNIVSVETINEYFNKTYAIYPRKVSKEQARVTYEHKFRGLEQDEAKKLANYIYINLEKQVQIWSAEKDGKGREREFMPHMSTWLNDNIPDSPHFKRKR